MKQSSNIKTKTSVFETSDYSLFTLMVGNREINKAHLKKLIQSMKQRQLVVPITVNDSFQVIDGQHRLEACKQLGLPVYFLIEPGAGLHEIQQLNTNQKDWTSIDYLQAYCELGIPDYIKFRDFLSNYNLGFNVSLALVSGRRIQNDSLTRKFKEGLFKVVDLRLAEKKAKSFCELKDVLPMYNQQSFGLCLIELLDKPVFDWPRFVASAKKYGKMLKGCKSKDDYMRAIDDMYNKGYATKISLRFSA